MGLVAEIDVGGSIAAFLGITALASAVLVYRPFVSWVQRRRQVKATAWYYKSSSMRGSVDVRIRNRGTTALTVTDIVRLPQARRRDKQWRPWIRRLPSGDHTGVLRWNPGSFDLVVAAKDTQEVTGQDSVVRDGAVDQEARPHEWRWRFRVDLEDGRSFRTWVARTDPGRVRDGGRWAGRWHRESDFLSGG